MGKVRELPLELRSKYDKTVILEWLFFIFFSSSSGMIGGTNGRLGAMRFNSIT